VHVFGFSPPITRGGYETVGMWPRTRCCPPRRGDDVIEFHRRLFPQWDVPLERQLWIQLDIKLGATIGKLSKGESAPRAPALRGFHKPELLILDEPAGRPDPAVRREFLEVAVQLLNRKELRFCFLPPEWGTWSGSARGGAAG